MVNVYTCNKKTNTGRKQLRELKREIDKSVIGIWYFNTFL